MPSDEQPRAGAYRHYVNHYDPAKSHHRAWLQAVLDRLVQHDPHALAEGSELRDLWKAAVETKAPTEKPDMTTSTSAAVAVALPLVKGFEGCKLTAYPDPASGGAPWTIGYGHTGAEVRPGLTISREQAEQVGQEVEALYVNGPAAGGGVTQSVREVVAVASALVPREAVQPHVQVLEL